MDEIEKYTRRGLLFSGFDELLEKRLEVDQAEAAHDHLLWAVSWYTVQYGEKARQEVDRVLDRLDWNGGAALTKPKEPVAIQ